MTKLQIEVACKVIARYRRTGGWYRAHGNGERVTLASLYRAGVLQRRAWRGVEGHPDCAHEYHPSLETKAELARAVGVVVPMSPCSSDVQAVARKAGRS